jgi:hypothetical protein
MIVIVLHLEGRIINRKGKSGNVRIFPRKYSSSLLTRQSGAHQSRSLQQTAGHWSNAGLGIEIGAGALAYVAGYHKHNSYLRDTGFKVLAARGRATLGYVTGSYLAEEDATR